MSRRWHNAALRAWRLGALLGIALAVGVAHRSARTSMPLAIREVARLAPAARSLDDDVTAAGQVVRDADGAPLGHAMTTSPDGDTIHGYAGPTEVLVVVDGASRVIGARIRRSEDTPEHVADVAAATRFWDRVVGRAAAELAGRTARALGVDGVSGATATSLAVFDAVAARLARAVQADTAAHGPAVDLHQIALAAFAVGGVLLAFLRGARRRAHLRRAFQVCAVAYLGLWSGELLALSLGAGFARSGLPWLRAPGLAVLAALAWLVPWATGRNPYCGHVCPHGALQEWIGRATRGRVPRARLPSGLRSFLRAVPATLLVTAVVALAVGMPLDLASVEAFDAWLLGAGATASIAIALAGLALSAVEPMAYCRYGCATGRLIALGATHPHARHRLDARDALLAALLVAAIVLAVARDPARALIAEVPL